MGSVLVGLDSGLEEGLVVVAFFFLKRLASSFFTLLAERYLVPALGPRELVMVNLVNPVNRKKIRKKSPPPLPF
jgi:hypothetical protein